MRAPNVVNNCRPVVAVDPGHTKCGVAVVTPAGDVLFKDVIPAAMVVDTVRVLYDDHDAGLVVVGGGTTSADVVEHLTSFFGEDDITTVEESHTTLQARALYWADNKPGCLARFVPTGLLIPPRPLDDYAAVVIARRHFDTRHADTHSPEKGT
ncbi:MAG: pre-16S rRNA-processing nuclease YqgF [Armatimonadota bacterium]